MQTSSSSTQRASAFAGSWNGWSASATRPHRIALPTHIHPYAGLQKKARLGGTSAATCVPRKGRHALPSPGVPRAYDALLLDGFRSGPDLGLRRINPATWRASDLARGEGEEGKWSVGCLRGCLALVGRSIRAVPPRCAGSRALPKRACLNITRPDSTLYDSRSARVPRGGVSDERRARSITAIAER